VDESDIALRNLTYGQFRELGRAPTAEEVASASGSSIGDVRAGWRRLHDAHALVINPGTTEIRMANPFSAIVTAYSVHAAGRRWYGNCAWDAFGILATLHVDGRVESSCPDCREAISVEVYGERPNETNLVFHCLVPARQWWNDIAFT
jgi:hypothetical protein